MKKKLILTLLAFTFAFQLLYAQLEWLNPKPSGYSNQSAFFINNQEGFILNNHGDLLRTTNQGVSWEITKNFPGAFKMDVKDSVAVVIGYNTLHYSNNYGESWQMMNTPGTVNLVDIVTKDSFFLANTNGKIYRTDDAGKTWKSFTTNKTLSSFDFADSKTGYVGCTSSSILKTEDGGVSWQSVLEVNTIPSNTLSIKFFDANNGFAFREHSSLLSTKDGGKTWASYYMGDDMFSITFIDRQNAIACGEHGVIYRTRDAGVTWQYISPDGRIWFYDLYAVTFADDNNGIATGARGRILKTTDGGDTWIPYSPTYVEVYGMTKMTDATSYAIAGNQIYKTTDAGSSWNPLALVGNDVFKQIHFFNKDTGVVTASNQGRIYKTYNGGINWTIVPSSLQGYESVAELQFLPNTTTGYLTFASYSSGSNIMKTTDAGETWKELWKAQYQGESFNHVFFTSEKNAFAARYKSLYHSTDSAKTWSLLWQQEAITDIKFVNEKIGFISGENGFLSKSIDSGKKWTKIPISPSYYDDIYCVNFFNEEVGFIGTEGGMIYRSIDSGKTWQQFDRVNFYRINIIMFSNDSTVYFTGENGAIVRSTLSELKLNQPVASTRDCNTELSAAVNALLGKAENLQFEYGISDFTNAVPATNNIVNSQQQTVKATITGLPHSTIYKVRLKADFRGKIYYSGTSFFKTADRPAVPVITSSTSRFNFCEGDSLTLSSNASAGNQWYLNGDLIQGAQQQSYTAKVPGAYQLTRTLFCYLSDTAASMISTVPLPPKPVITSNGDALFSSANNGSQWYLNGNVIAGETNAQLTPITNGLYTVKVSENFCTSVISDAFDFIVPGKDFIVYPNPASNQVTVRNALGEKMLIQLFDLYGNLVYNNTTASGSLSINLSTMSSGRYTVKVTLLDQNKTSSQVLIKK
jgi:photosystem II stability/assembly factor-like uncharacterized protein